MPLMKPSPFSLSALLVAVALARGADAPVDWPEWRGPDAQGHATAKGVPETWSETQNIAWRCNLPGRGWSTPVMNADQIWLSTALETPASPEEVAQRTKVNTADQPLTVLSKVELKALCVDGRTGRLLWDIPLITVQDPQWVHELNSYASPSPVLEPGRAYFHFGTFGTFCVEVGTGGVVWANTNLHIMHENGPGSSPILVGDLLLFHLDGSDSQSIAALDKKTGRLVWRTNRSGKMNEHPQLKKSYATPTLTQWGGRPAVLSQGADWIYAYEPSTGRELWKVPYGNLGFSLSSRAVLGEGRVYFATGYSRSEIQAVQLGGPDTAPATVWKYAKGAPTMSSLLLVGSELYFVSDSGGMLTCLDARTGREHYRERLGGSHSASPLYVDGRILLCSREGETCVMAPGPTFKLIARNRLPGKLMASPIASGESLYLRTDTALYRIQHGK
ncbi:MAG: PQQ-like beta-propeller repeat protein [Verrucomicrobia bacterium]|nr:PQQ-like beta-propeller repeat protein [Verrucomicrobiota bacterium]